MSDANLRIPFQLQPDLDEFLNMIVEQKNYSTLTQKNYRRQLTCLVDFMETLKLSAWLQIKPIHIRQLSAQQHRRGKSAKSIALLLSSCRSFFQFLVNTDRLPNNPAKNVRPPKGEKKLPKTMDVDQVTLLLENIDVSETIGIRDKAIAELFYSSGLRLAELADCNVEQVDLTEQIATVTGKGNKTRIVPVGRKAKAAINDWLTVRKEWLGGCAESALFVSQRKTRLSHRSIQKRLEYWGKRIGLNANLHPHKFRHSCATHVLESSGDIRAVQELLGHANLSTTQVYTHLDFQKLAAVYDKAHPRAKK
jgi:integrase/recombinase XerC